MLLRSYLPPGDSVTAASAPDVAMEQAAARSRLNKLPGLQIDGGAFAVVTALDIKRYCLILVQRRHASLLNGGDVHKHILGAVLRCNESETFGSVKKFYGACRGHNLPI
jgi:hypothetical protein